VEKRRVPAEVPGGSETTKLLPLLGRLALWTTRASLEALVLRSDQGERNVRNFGSRRRIWTHSGVAVNFKRSPLQVPAKIAEGFVHLANQRIFDTPSFFAFAWKIRRLRNVRYVSECVQEGFRSLLGHVLKKSQNVEIGAPGSSSIRFCVGQSIGSVKSMRFYRSSGTARAASAAGSVEIGMSAPI
jgi:hypothetical protein